MTNQELKELKEKIIKKEKENTKIMWNHADFFWKLIIILGIISLSYIMFKIGGQIGSLIG